MATYNGSDKRLGYLFQNGGGGGSSTLDGLSDVSLTTPTDGQVLSYDANADEWVNSSTANPSSIASMSDTDIQSPTDGQTLVYNSTSAKWENASGGASVHTYSTTEQVVGTWVDGKPIYEKTVDLGYLPNNTTYTVNHGISDIDLFISVQGIAQNTNGIGLPLPFASTTPANSIQLHANSTQVVIISGTNRSGYYGYATIQYTKSTD